MQGGSGYAKNITFQNVEMHNVRNPIIINQYYCDKKEPSCLEQVIILTKMFGVIIVCIYKFMCMILNMSVTWHNGKTKL
jgi:hypothetical protein